MSSVGPSKAELSSLLGDPSAFNGDHHADLKVTTAAAPVLSASATLKADAERLDIFDDEVDVEDPERYIMMELDGDVEVIDLDELYLEDEEEAAVPPREPPAGKAVAC